MNLQAKAVRTRDRSARPADLRPPCKSSLTQDMFMSGGRVGGSYFKYSNLDNMKFSKPLRLRQEYPCSYF